MFILRHVYTCTCHVLTGAHTHAHLYTSLLPLSNRHIHIQACTRSLSHTHTHTHTRSPSHSLTHTHVLSLTHSLTLSHSLTHSLTHTHTHTHTTRHLHCLDNLKVRYIYFIMFGSVKVLLCYQDALFEEVFVYQPSVLLWNKHPKQKPTNRTKRDKEDTDTINEMMK